MSDQIETPEDSEPTKLDDVQLDAAVGGATVADTSTRVIIPCVKVIIPCVKVVRPG